MMIHPRLPIAALCVAFLFSGCATFEQFKSKIQGPPPGPVLPPQPSKQSYWNGTGVEGEASIIISLSQQHAYFFKGEKLVGESKISSGRKGFETPPGRYKVIQKDKNHVSNLYGDYIDIDGEVIKRNVDVTKDPKPAETEFRGAKMPFFMRFTGGYGLHAGYLPGYRASHGCIRMPRKMVEHFFDNVKFGTVVTVQE